MVICSLFCVHVLVKDVIVYVLCVCLWIYVLICFYVVYLVVFLYTFLFVFFFFFFFQAEDGIRDGRVTGVQTCALPIYPGRSVAPAPRDRATARAVLRRVCRERRGRAACDSHRHHPAEGELRCCRDAGCEKRDAYCTTDGRCRRPQPVGKTCVAPR